MHIYHLDQWKHSHHYVMGNGHGERKTRRVILLTLSMMIIEISAGYVFGSMALLADGWHMGTHAVALGITAFAYYFARKNSDDPNYSFGTGKVGVLGGFASAVVLAVIALLMGVESKLIPIPLIGYPRLAGGLSSPGCHYFPGHPLSEISRLL
jgi:Co/Zn/Cd efflux system component